MAQAASRWDGDGVTGTGGAGAGRFKYPEGIALDGTGVYVDSGNRRIQKLDSRGSFVTMWGWGVADGTNALQSCSSQDRTHDLLRCLRKRSTDRTIQNSLQTAIFLELDNLHRAGLGVCSHGCCCRAGAMARRAARGRNVICGLGGRDTLIGRAGNDVLRGGAGGDLLRGGRGRDLLNGGTGVDRARAESRRDTKKSIERVL